MATDRQKAIDKAVKVFRQGVSTGHAGEKLKCVQVLSRLSERHGLMLCDIDASLPRRWDAELLRIKIGLVVVSASAAGAGGGQGTANVDLESLLFQHLDVAERKRRLQGPLFSQGVFKAVERTSAYTRLLAEAHSLDRSNVGVGLGDQELMTWLDRALSRQGSRVESRPTSHTIFEDLVAYCRAGYMTETGERRKAEQHRQRQEQRQQAEAERKRAEAQRRDRERQAAEDRRKREQREAERVRRENEGRGHLDDEAEVFAMAFDERAVARLYLKVARQQVGTRGTVKPVTAATGQLVVKLLVTAALKDDVDLAFRKALHDLQVAAARVRDEAARNRDEAVRRAEAAYASECELAFERVVDRYVA
ncbi:hypothetical protein [Deinococcus humi]|uniref:Uncharacterized protein n=1 Tax=Deinococcus humi TaxID=662880 RepID=A0A7W8JUR7_9DEIO|nr:hypothetical protein [Deinococcus humi]MBB5363652.1 hypothetical protein [Deinococcus humi]GGO29907.1 hypothetical protein GCM10008949_24040 [Deinococcus humi]